MQEPSVIVKMIVPPSVNPTLSGDIIAGAVNTDCGPYEPLLCSRASDVLKWYTKKGKIERTTDPTVIHAYKMAELYPVLLCRVDSRVKDTNLISGLKFTDEFTFDSVSYESGGEIPALTSGKFAIYLKTVTNDSYDIVLAFNNPASVTRSLTLNIKQGDVVLETYSGTYSEVIDSITSDSNIIDIVGKDEYNNSDYGHLVNVTYKSRLSGNATLSTVSGIAISMNLEATDVFYNYGELPQTPDYLAIYQKYTNAQDFKVRIKYDDSEITNPNHLITVIVGTPSRPIDSNPYEYVGSLDPDHIDANGNNDWIGNCNELQSEFELVLGDNLEIPTATDSEIQTITGSISYDPSALIAVYKAAIDLIVDDDRYQPAFLVPFGHRNKEYGAYLAMTGNAIHAFTPYGVFSDKNDPESINNDSPAATQNLLVMTPNDITTEFGFKFELSAEYRYIQTIKTNAGLGRKFAPVMGKTNGTFAMNKIAVTLTKKTREKLLDYRIMSIVDDTPSGICYLNKNKLKSTDDSVLSEEQNVRLAQQINRDMITLMKPFLGEFNNIQTRSRVLSVISTYFNTNILNQIYGIDGYRAVCDETNNTPAIIAANKLVIDLYVTYNKTIYEVQIFHRAFDVNNTEV